MKLPSFDISAEEIKKNSAKIISDAQKRFDHIGSLKQSQRSFQNTVAAFDQIEADVEDQLNILVILQQASPHSTLRESAEHAVNELQRYLDVDIYSQQSLYTALSSCKDKTLSSAEEKVLSKKLLKFKHNGFGLSEKKQNEVLMLKKQLIQEELEFSKNIRECSDELWLTNEELKGLEDNFISSLEQKNGKYRLTMAYPHVTLVMAHAVAAKIRKKVQSTFLNRAREKNLPLLDDILHKRRQLAEKLNHDHYADYILEDRMAKNAATVVSFLDDLQKKFQPRIIGEIQKILDMKQKDFPNAREVEDWDIGYYATRYKNFHFDLDEQKLKSYFPLEHVTTAAFELFKKLFGIEMKEVKEEKKMKGRKAWHKEVELFEVKDTATREILGHFYLDLFPRPGKYSHAAIFPLYEGRRLADGTYQLPACVMFANFSRPTASSPSLLTPGEVKTYFHEFGHILHLLCSRQEYRQLSGYRVAWDFVEVPSQIMENWFYEPESLKLVSKHYETGKPLSDEMIRRMIAAKDTFPALNYSRQVMLSKLNHLYHTEKKVDTTALLKQLWKEIRGIPMPEGTHFQASFGHLIGYAAAYYSYLWSRVFSEDLFTRFQSEGVLNAHVGMELRKKILEPGASEDELVLVENFLGRTSNNKAFFKSIGLV